MAYYKVQVVATENILLVLGTHDLKHWATNDATTRGASSVRVHPDFSTDSAHADVAVITLGKNIFVYKVSIVCYLSFWFLDKPVTFSEKIRPICLWKFSDSLDDLINTRGTVAGWGMDETNATVQISKFAQIPVVSQFDCLKADQAFREITSDKTFCAGKIEFLVS